MHRSVFSVPAAVLLSLLGACADAAPSSRQTAASFPDSASAVPDFTIHTYAAAGVPSGVAHLYAQRGKVVVVSFWASWCGPCEEELPELSRLAERYRADGLVVYPVLHDDDRAKAQAWMHAHGVALPLLVDDGKVIARRYRVRGLPDAYLIGRDGRLLRWQQGYEGPGHWEPRLREALGLPAT